MISQSIRCMGQNCDRRSTCITHHRQSGWVEQFKSAECRHYRPVSPISFASIAEKIVAAREVSAFCREAGLTEYQFRQFAKSPRKVSRLYAEGIVMELRRRKLIGRDVLADEMFPHI